MKSFALLLIGVSLAITATGCCCLNPCGTACGYAGYGSSCPGGACSPSYAPGYPAVVPQGAFYNGISPSQFSAAPAPVYNSFAAAPPTYVQTAMAGPLDPLPTF